MKVLPILIYEESDRKNKISWREWGEIRNREKALEEKAKIEKELSIQKEKMDPSITFLNLLPISSEEDVYNFNQFFSEADAFLIYPASGAGHVSTIELILSLFNKPLLFFIRVKTGYIYEWYEIIDARFFRKAQYDFIVQEGVSYNDVVVDDYDELIKKLNALNALILTQNAKVLCIGKPDGWGIGYKAVKNANKVWNFNIEVINYSSLKELIKKKKSDKEFLEKVEVTYSKFLQKKNMKVLTDNKFIKNAILIYLLFKELLNSYAIDIITIGECMTTIIPIAETTACLPLSLLNNEGYIAICEGDFVALPAFILLQRIARRPIFLNDPTFPYDGKVILAHCTSPTLMDGKNEENFTVLTHYESDFGAAPKVQYRVGEKITGIIPDFGGREWIIFLGEIIDNPSFSICRSQMEVKIYGNWEKLRDNLRGFHWVVTYGDFRKEISYALEKAGINSIVI